MPEFRIETLIAAPADACFSLSLSVDAHTASMSGTSERAIGGTTRGEMALGDVVTWRARHFGIPFEMTSAITAYEFPDRFVDEQQHGPFRSWWHEHTFTPVDAHSTRMVDTVRFTSPLGPLGTITDRAVLNRYLPNLIRHRNDWLRRTLDGRAAS